MAKPKLAGASAAVPADIDGLSIVPTLTGQGTQMEHQSLYFEFDNGMNDGGPSNRMQGVVWDRGDGGVTTTWKLVIPNPSAALELYKLKVDGVPVGPAESNNLASFNSYKLGDTNNSGQVDMEDFLAFRQTWELLYGASALSQLSTSVSEPGTSLLLTTVLITLTAKQHFGPSDQSASRRTPRLRP